MAAAVPQLRLTRDLLRLDNGRELVLSGVPKGIHHEFVVEFRRVDDMKADCKSCPAVHACGSMCVAVSYDQFRELGRTVGRYCDLRRLDFKHATWAHYALRREGCRAFMSEFYPAARRTVEQPARSPVGGPPTPCPIGYGGSAPAKPA